MLPSRLTRRTLLKVGAGAAAGAAVTVLAPRPLLADFGGVALEPLPPIQDPKVKELALRAITASRAAGADYADVRLTHTRRREIRHRHVTDQEDMHVGVRAVIDGSWGFASGPIWSPDEMARLGREAAAQARAIAAIGQPSLAPLAPLTSPAEGHWATPVKLDPFEVSPFEMMDFVGSLNHSLRRRFRGNERVMSLNTGYNFSVQMKAFASTEGSYCTQQLYRSEPRAVFAAHRLVSPTQEFLFPLEQSDLLAPSGAGWEIWRDRPIRETLERLADEVDRELLLPDEDPEVGRYDAVVSPYMMATLVQGTLGRATELDRALGYEANGGGTSYLNDPLGMIGKYQVGTDLLTVTANRTEPNGCATVRWDDEGVSPADFTLVRDGIVEDFQTTRESAGVLQEVYTRRQQPVRSHGCAYAPTASDATMSHMPNLAVAPGPDALDFDAMLRDLKDGIAIKQAKLSMDFQGLNGVMVGSPKGAGTVYRVKGGKLVSQIRSGNVLFRAPMLWKGLLALGGAASVQRLGLAAEKGEPAQESWHTVKTPPGLFKQLTLIDARRKS